MSEHHTSSLQPGTVIGGKYEVVKCLGAGSMGMVYACRHRDLQGQLVAAKVLFSEVASDTVAAARFKNEILASYGVSHPNVVRAYEFVRDGDIIAYTMEFVGGGDLADRMARSELLSIAEILRLLSQMAAGVQAIHDAGIVHRDLKPENILLTNEGSVKIADFGIARKTDGPKLTEHGGVVGTLEYVSPEYMLRSQVDWRSDIYAMGVLAYELITGEPPFKGDSAYASISMRLQTDATPPSRFRVECPSGLDRIVLKALRRDPEHRYQSAVEMFSDLQEVAAALGISGGTASGILIPPTSTTSGSRYVGPSLSKAIDNGSESKETQLLTSDGPIDYTGSGFISAARRPSTTGAEDFRDRQATTAIGPNTGSARETRVNGSTRDGATLHTGAAPIERAATRRPDRLDDDQVIDFASDILQHKERRLQMLDIMILLFAALSGVGVGYLFLRLFAPTFLEKLSVFGFGS
jgi:serine/threonine protein kinase